MAREAVVVGSVSKKTLHGDLMVLRCNAEGVLETTPGAHGDSHETGGDDIVEWSKMDKAVDDTTRISDEIDGDVAAHAALPNVHHPKVHGSAEHDATVSKKRALQYLFPRRGGTWTNAAYQGDDTFLLIDLDAFDKIAHIYFVAMFHISAGAGTAYVKLYNVTDAEDVTGSEVSTNSTDHEIHLISGDLASYFAGKTGRKKLEVYRYVTGGATGRQWYWTLEVHQAG